MARTKTAPKDSSADSSAASKTETKTASDAPEAIVETKPVQPAPPPISKEKSQALDRALGQIEKSFGKGSIMRLDEDAYLSIPGISTGALSLDLALGGRGIPRGRIVEIFGPESSGKTTLALTVVSQHARRCAGGDGAGEATRPAPERRRGDGA